MCKIDRDGHNCLDCSPPRVKQLISSTLNEIQNTHKNIDKIVRRHNVHHPPEGATLLPVREEDCNIEQQQDHQHCKVKGKASWVIHDHERFQANVDKLSKTNKYLFESLSLEAMAAAARALPAFTVAASTSDTDLQFLQQSPRAQMRDENFVSNCATLKLLKKRSSGNSIPSIPYSSIDIGHIESARSTALFRKSDAEVLRVFVEWKAINPELDIERRQKIVERIKDLAILLHQPKEPDFYLPPCIGLCHDGSSRYGYVFNVPSLMSGPSVAPKPLIHLLEAARCSGEKALLGERFKLAQALTSSFALLHSADWLHKGLRSNNILFFQDWNITTDRIPISCMQVVGFEYSRLARPEETSIETQPTGNDSDIVLYQHPKINQGYRKLFDIYSLGVVLFGIALWRPLKTKFPRNKGVTGMDASERKDFLLRSVDLLGGEVGEAYRDVVRVCLTGDFGDGVLEEDDSSLPRAFLRKVVNVLEGCRA